MAGSSDQSHTTGTLPQATRGDFSGVGYDEAMRRAREIVPILRERGSAYGLNALGGRYANPTM